MVMKKLLLSALFLTTCAVVFAAKPKVIAHMGAWELADSAINSQQAMLKSAELKCYGSEFDVQQTVDGVLVVYHDNFIDGVRIQDTTYGNIQYTRLKNGEYMPTLIQFLQTAKSVPELKLILEIKPHITPERNRMAAEAVVKLVNEMNLADRIEYISFNPDACDELRRQAPEAKIAFLEGVNDVTPQQLKDWNLTGMNYHYTHYNRHPEWLKQAKDLGLGVYVWTVDGEDLLRQWIAVPEVEYITTNNPSLLKKLLSE